MWIIFKFAITAAIVVLVSETAKRSTVLGGLLASLPLISVLSMIWLYVETSDTERIAQFSREVFWLVLPSLALFVVLPPLLRAGFNFYLSLGASCLVTGIAYFAVFSAMKHL